MKDEPAAALAKAQTKDLAKAAAAVARKAATDARKANTVTPRCPCCGGTGRRNVYLCRSRKLQEIERQ